MASVTKRVSEVKQPRGGYLKVSDFSVENIDGGKVLQPDENISPQLIGRVVDYLARFNCGHDQENAFKYAIQGAKNIGAESIAKKLLSGIKGLDDASIINACQLSFFDVWYRSPVVKADPADYEKQIPDAATISNIRIMTERCLGVLTSGDRKVIKHGFDFAFRANGMKVQDAYTNTISSGDGDFITLNRINQEMWDIKVSQSEPKSSDTLQLLIYWIMRGHLTNMLVMKTESPMIGIINPRLGKVYTYNAADLSDDIIETIEKEVIGY